MSSQNAPSIQIERVLKAPRSEVFQWWAEAEKLQQWLGCKQCIGSEIQMDFRVGGGFTQTMKIAVGAQVCDFVMKATYTEIVVPERISYRLDMGQHHTTSVRVEFFDQEAATRVVFAQDGFSDPESCKMVSQGISDSLDELDSFVKDAAGSVRRAITESA
jgi:uncharacterized protein YndB with AHSA1/START domain